MGMQNTFNREVAEQIKWARQKAGKTQFEVLIDTGIHIGRIEQGKISIQLYTLFKLCKYLNIKCIDLLKDVDDPPELVKPECCMKSRIK